MLLVLFKDWAPLLRKKNLPQPNPAATAPQASEPAVADASKKEPPKKSYDFYKVLEANEVVIPDAELTEKARAEQQAQECRRTRHRRTLAGARRRAGDGIGRPLHPAGRLVSRCERRRRDQGEARAARIPGAGAAGHGQRQGVASRAARAVCERERSGELRSGR